MTAYKSDLFFGSLTRIGRVQVVDDEPNVRRVVRRVLTGFPDTDMTVCMRDSVVDYLVKRERLRSAVSRAMERRKMARR